VNSFIVQIAISAKRLHEYKVAFFTLFYYGLASCPNPILKLLPLLVYFPLWRYPSRQVGSAKMTRFP